MLRYAIFPIWCSLLVVSCITPETQAKIDATTQDVADLKAQLHLALLNGQPQETLDALQKRLKAAETKLSDLQDQGAAERAETAGKIQTALSKGDYVGAGLVALTTLIASFAGYKKIQTRRATKKSVAVIK